MFELELPLQDGGISFINGSAVPITPGKVICAKPGQTRFSKFPYVCRFVHFTVADPVLRGTVSSLPDFTPLREGSGVEELFCRLCSSEGAYPPFGELEASGILLELIAALGKIKTAGPGGGKSFFDMDRVLDFIRDHICEDLSLERVSETFYLSPVHFHNLFKKALGVTLREYVEKQRLNRAAELLLTTDLPLARIALSCGFSSQSYFSFVFRRAFGTTPMRYVRQLCTGYEK